MKAKSGWALCNDIFTTMTSTLGTCAGIVVTVTSERPDKPLQCNNEKMYRIFAGKL